jgi:hypothetical protein
VSQGGADRGGRPAGSQRLPSRVGLASNGGPGWRSPPISAAVLRKFVPFDEPLQRLHCVVEELEIPGSRENRRMRRPLRPHEPLYGARRGKGYTEPLLTLYRPF